MGHMISLGHICMAKLGRMICLGHMICGAKFFKMQPIKLNMAQASLMN